MRSWSFFSVFLFLVLLSNQHSNAQSGSVDYDASTGSFSGNLTDSASTGDSSTITSSTFSGSVDQTGNISGSFSSVIRSDGQRALDNGTFTGVIDGSGNYSINYSGGDISGSFSGSLSGFSAASSGSYGLNDLSTSSSGNTGSGANVSSVKNDRESAQSRNPFAGTSATGYGGGLAASLFGGRGAGLEGPGGVSFGQLSLGQQREAIALLRMRRLKLWFLREASACRPRDNECLSDALKAYGNHLRAIPVTDSQVPAIASAVILEAAESVQTSASSAQTRRILQESIRKIELYAYVRSDDETIEAFQRQQKAEVLSSLIEYESEYVRIAGL